MGRDLLEALPDTDVQAAFIFGSVAWGDADVTSDLDIMLLLDRDPPWRQVTRVRLADVIGDRGSAVPRFADLDRISVKQFELAVSTGRWAPRVVNAIALRDSSRRFLELQKRVTAHYTSNDARVERWSRQRQVVDDYLLSASAAQQSRQPELAMLNGRLAVRAASTALVEADGNRSSPSHLIDSVGGALERAGKTEFMPRFLRALALDDDPESAVDCGMRAHRSFAKALARWIQEPKLRTAMSPEDLAWAEFTGCAETYEEIHHKLTQMRKVGAASAMVAYVDGLLETPVRINTSKVLNWRSAQTMEIMSEPGFHAALSAVPELREQWISGLRLSEDATEIREAHGLAHELLRVSRPAC